MQVGENDGAHLQCTLSNQARDVPLVLEAQSVEARLGDDTLGSCDHIGAVLRGLQQVSNTFSPSDNSSSRSGSHGWA